MRPRVLLYRTLGLGDFLTAVPAYRAVVRAHSGACVVLAAPEPLRPLARLCGGVDVFLPTAQLHPPRWAGPPPDVAVNLHGRGPESHRALALLRPGSLLAFRNNAAGVPGPTWNAVEHEVRRWCRMLRAHGVRAVEDDLLLPKPPRPSAAFLTVLHPGAASPRRRWPASRFAAVAASLAAHGHHVVVTGDAGERALTASVVERAHLPAAADLGGRLDLAGLAALVAHARLVMSGDTGVAHLASAFGTPSVVLFGGMSPALWGPPLDGPHVALWHGDVSAGTDGRPDPGLLDIGVDEVLDACRRITLRPRSRLR